MITVALADDEPLFTTGLALILRAQPGMQVSWQAADGTEALRQHATAPPDVLLLDVQMPGLDGLHVTQHLINQQTTTRITILTTFSNNEYVLTAIENGAAGFILKNSPPDQLINAIRTVHSGEAVISPGPTRQLFETFRNSHVPPSL